MKTKKTINYVVIYLSLTLLFTGCQPKIDFQKTSNSKIKSLTTINNVAGFRLRFNPKGNGAILFTLSNGAEYTASNLNAGQVSSLLTMLQSNSLKFDTVNEEFILRGGIHE